MSSLRKTITLLVIGFCMVVLNPLISSAQTIPDSILKKIDVSRLGPYDTIPVPAMIEESTLVPLESLQWVWVQVPYPPHLLKKRQAYNRLRNAIYVTYPYAQKAAAVINDINKKLAGVESRSERKKYIKTREKELRKEFADPLTELSVYQGKVLMKLINRQTGNNCYEIIKEYKGGVTARVYQTVAFFFNSSLKQPYDRSDTDREMEIIVQEVERMYSRR